VIVDTGGRNPSSLRASEGMDFNDNSLKMKKQTNAEAIRVEMQLQQ